MWKYFLYGFALFTMLWVAVMGLRYYLAPVFGIVDAEVKIESGDNRRYTYDHFYNLCAAAQSVDATLRGQIQLLESLDPNSDQHMRTLQTIAGLNARRYKLIAQYNGDSAKGYTDARFKDRALPRTLSNLPVETTTPITCAY